MDQNKYDILIAGSGLGGLVCGYILSKNGYKVIILEKNHQIGGCLQTFTRKGVKFDTGMHYIGSLEEGQVLYRFFKYLNLLKDVPVSNLDPSGFDIVSIAGEKYPMALGYDNFIENLSKKFPENKDDICNYIKRIQEIAAASPLNNLQEINTHVFIEADYIKTGVYEFIQSVTKNSKLQNVLAWNLPLYAGIKDKTPTYIHALINNFYIQSACRIIGGSDKIAISLANSIKAFGGKIITNAEVEQFICDNHKMISVLLSNKEKIEADYFISNIHPQVTMEKINSNLIRNVYRERIAGIENSISNFTVFIKFKENATPYLNYNYYHYDVDDVWYFNDYDVDKWPQSYMYMHQISQENMKYADCAQLITYMRFDEVKEWINTTVEKRGDKYLQFKADKTTKLLNKLEESFPGINSKIDSVYSASPLTYRDYTNTKEGSIYGIIRDKNFPTQTLISQRTKIPNLFMTGQNINTHGILGVTIGAMITCAEFLGLNTIIKQIDKANN